MSANERQAFILFLKENKTTQFKKDINQYLTM